MFFGLNYKISIYLRSGEDEPGVGLDFEPVRGIVLAPVLNSVLQPGNK